MSALESDQFAYSQVDLLRTTIQKERCGTEMYLSMLAVSMKSRATASQEYISHFCDGACLLCDTAQQQELCSYCSFPFSFEGLLFLRCAEKRDVAFTVQCSFSLRGGGPGSDCRELGSSFVDRITMRGETVSQSASSEIRRNRTNAHQLDY